MATISRLTVRTSNRRTFRRCLRKWGWQSSMRHNLERRGAETNIAFWFGSAIHFAMEDYFGYNRFGDPVKAFAAYYAAFKPIDRPSGADEHYYLGTGMLEYFNNWYRVKNQSYGFETVWLDEDKNEVPPGTEGARPLVEESFILNLGKDVWIREDTGAIIDIDECFLERDPDTGRLFLASVPGGGLDASLVLDMDSRVYVSKQPTYYHGTLDRVVRDRAGRWWIMDWKTAKSADTNKLDTDDQISAYLWAAEQWFGRPIHGFMYVQLTKELAKPPKMLNNGQMSVDKKQKTSWALAKAQIEKLYGNVRAAPMKIIDFLDYLASLETPEGDRYVRWDAVTRSKEEKISTYNHIMGEMELMTNPHLYLFPNFTRDCIWDCPFRDACMMMDNGQLKQAEAWINENFAPRPREEDGNIDRWRENIPWPDSPMGNAVVALEEEMSLSASKSLNVILPDKYLGE
ncbi:PD-(D/E)XK nuclease superfamily protein [compost metagenome]